MSLNVAVKEVTLGWGSFQDTTLYQVQPGTTLRFRPGPDCIVEEIRLFTNYPSKDQFQRDTYRELRWQYTNQRDRASYYTELIVSLPGSFHFYYTSAPTKSEDPVPRRLGELPVNAVGSGYFQVPPLLSCASNSVPLDSIACQTYLSKLLGPITTWKDKLEVAAKSGYNMIHFTPIQALGFSKSAYSLADQLALNPSFSTPDMEATFEDVDKVVEQMRKEWGMLSICDVVLNHTANNSDWLGDHPDATYNLSNCPHLRPAFLLDRCIKRLARDIGEGRWVDEGVPKGEVSTAGHLEVCKKLLDEVYLPIAAIPQLYLCDVEAIISEFKEEISKRPNPLQTSSAKERLELVLIQDEDYRRHSCTINMEVAIANYNLAKDKVNQEEERIKACVENLRTDLLRLNSVAHAEVSAHLTTALANVVSGAFYQHVDPKGPQHIRVSIREDEEFVAPYFTCPDLDTLEQELELAWSEEGKLCMAHNGWVMGDDPLRDFAMPGSQVYLRRELVAWGDSVKLRYGSCPEDSPYLWSHMRAYVLQTARIFDGLRLDNCHSTPLHVASYMLDEARRLKPNLYVSAELFTGSEEKDNIFVNKLGITSLIREGLAAWDSHELGRMVHRYGGRPVGSFEVTSNVSPLTPATAHALFMDWTHDNPSPVEKRTVMDMLPSAALVSMASCAVGSNRGYDELVPHHIHVVNEERPYASWNQVKEVGGMVKARHALISLHQRLAREGFSEVFVDQLNRDVVCVTRHNPQDRRSVLLAAHTAFFPGDTLSSSGCTVEVEGKLREVLFEAKMVGSKGSTEFKKEEGWINGMASMEVELTTGLVNLEEKSGKLKLDLAHLLPGSVVAVEVMPNEDHRLGLSFLASPSMAKLEEAVSPTSLLDIQFALFQCDQEGQESGFGVYSVPNWGPLNYCGLAGVMPLLDKMRPSNDLGHPLAANLRDGDWMLDYILARLESRPGLTTLANYTKEAFSHLRTIPRYLIPRYFDQIVSQMYRSLRARAISLMSSFVSNGSDFQHALAMGGVIHTAVVPSAPLPAVSTDLTPSPIIPSPTLAAGLPHFSTGYMRSWGRDTFISLRGALLVTGRLLEARDILLGYAATLRHGLIPNLLDGGFNARYNCRDAIWWWLRAVLDYIEFSKDEGAILSSPVLRLWPQDDSPKGSTVEQRLAEVIHEALTKHLQGLKFRERNAGPKIDEHMKDEGFNNEIGVDPKTGFVFGGNIWNCGTWMDKMGSSTEAGNKGKPSTPRDGSAVELVGLSFSCLRDLVALPLSVYPYQTFEAASFASLSEWADKIKENFDAYFWVGGPEGSQVEPNPHLVNKTKIYKDSVGSGTVFTDYQLRPNFAITLAVAPDICCPEKAWASLTSLSTMMGPLGLATLNQEDWAYRGDYVNSNQSCDPSIAQGANYHQGPEWVWPVGFYCRALLSISQRLGDEEKEEALQRVTTIMSRHFQHLNHSPWMGLPELTNSKGAYCPDSNPIQAWSMACMLDALYDLQKLQ